MAGYRFSDLSWRAKVSYVAHSYKAIAKQHHTWMTPIFTRLVGADGVVFDIGAHAGQYAKLLARIATQGRVYAFEPSGYACSILRLATRVNGLSNVSIRCQGLGDKPGNLTLNTPLKPSGTFQFGLAHLGDETEGPVHREDVPVTTIDDVAGDEGLRRLDFIKMDVEGWEMRALVGGQTTIRRYRPAMLIELVDAQLAEAGDSLVSAWRLLQSWGYTPALLGVDGETLTPIEEPLESDIFWLPG